jgi:hypothetical protein
MSMAFSLHRWERECMKVLVGNPEGNRPQRRYKPSLKNYIKINLRSTECGGMD